jgi:putative transposase
MARRPRLVVPGHAHYVIQRGHGGRVLFSSPSDRASFLSALNEAAHAEGVLLHAYALLDHEVHLLVTPSTRTGLGRLVQAVGRNYVSAHNRRNHLSGTLWDGRFRACVLDAGTPRLAALRLIDGLASEALQGSAAHRLGTAGRDAALVTLHEVPELWQLGNTPFEREAAYGRLLSQGLPTGLAEKLRRAALGGLAVGTAAFVSDLEQSTGLAAQERRRGRPRRLTDG